MVGGCALRAGRQGVDRRPNDQARRKRARDKRQDPKKGTQQGQKSSYQRAVDVRDDTTAGDRGLDERVELLVSADGQLQVAGRDALDLEVLGRVARELEHLGGQVLFCICLFVSFVALVFGCWSGCGCERRKAEFLEERGGRAHKQK